MLVISGTTDGYLTPCGCGGQDAGGLPRRAAMIAEIRAAHPGVIVIDPGRFGMTTERLPVITRFLGAIGVDAVGCGADDLVGWPRLLPLARSAGLSLTSLLPPFDAVPADQLAPRSIVIGSGPNRIGILSVALGTISGTALAERAAAELTHLRSEERVAFCVLLSHLGSGTTERLVDACPPALRPLLVGLATEQDEPAPAYERLGCWWVPLAHKGRSLSVVTIDPDGAGWRVAVEQKLVAAGPTDERIQSLVDDYYRREKEGEAAQTLSSAPSFPPVSACTPCHDGTVAAWRAHPHAHAVTTLERLERDVAACLRCHSERLRRDGVRPQRDGDRGVVCASCHDELARHLTNPKDERPSIATTEACDKCHTTEHSPGWKPARYLAAIAEVCRGPADLEGGGGHSE